MNTSSNNPQITLLRERVDDIAAYLELWNNRGAATDKVAARAAGSMALERINAAAYQLADMSHRLLAELQAFDDGVHAGKDRLLRIRRTERDEWLAAGTGPGYPAGDDQADDDGSTDRG